MKNFYPLNLLHKTEEIPIFTMQYNDFLESVYKFYNLNNFDLYKIPNNNSVINWENYWNIIDLMPVFINQYIRIFSPKSNEYNIKNIHFINKDQIYLSDNINFEGEIILNATNGPIIIDSNTNLRNFTTIEGPAYIGKNSVLDNATIRGPFICGKVNKLSGEIEESFFMDYINKHHYGFIGHSIIENWVNLGAGTTNSDLKNNYSNIKIFNGKEYINSNKIKLGCIIGEHSKTAIGTMINTGTVIAPFCNIFETPNSKHIFPFSWGNSNKYQLDKLLLTVKNVMERRNITPDNEYLNKIKILYNNYS